MRQLLLACVKRFASCDQDGRINHKRYPDISTRGQFAPNISQSGVDLL